MAYVSISARTGESISGLMDRAKRKAVRSVSKLQCARCESWRLEAGDELISAWRAVVSDGRAILGESLVTIYWS